MSFIFFSTPTAIQNFYPFHNFGNKYYAFLEKGFKLKKSLTNKDVAGIQCFDLFFGVLQRSFESFCFVKKKGCSNVSTFATKKNSPTQAQCQGKANSQTIAAYIDPTEGVQFQDTQQEEGPSSSLTISIIDNDKGFEAFGDLTFGYDPNTQTQTLLTFTYNQNDVVSIVDQNNDRFIDAGFVNITGLYFVVLLYAISIRKKYTL
ncbi:hypothetical protein RFI_20617 [Reticulomyxa filosa]|uniref:Transmembrane protein n=1 Tax=Reticulomyxa filosa TaxID=46433 RepID=X6MTD7_RETFI|nr:hypothetical protein RFI_20617 [Reticulomyxa filosa]|eukprot:ETO16727.1 hypothetical protein RFI_20617 [Reticulomyxa filosa]